VGIGGPIYSFETFEQVIADQNVKIGQVNNPDEINKFILVLTLNFNSDDFYSIRVRSRMSYQKDVIYSILNSFKIF